MRAAFGTDENGGAVVSLSEGGRVLVSIAGTATDDLLALLESALRAARKSISEVREIAVDRGPDGFSTVRRRVAIATGLSRSLRVPLAAASDLSLEELARLPPPAFTTGTVVVPLYAGVPNITASKRKNTWTTR